MTASAVRSLGSARANTEQALDRSLRRSQFATMSCPSWAIGRVERLTVGSAARWGVVAPPGRSGNWGGTFVAVPKSRPRVQQATQLAHWLTAPEQQLSTFRALRIYPALNKTPPEVVAYRSEAFDNADVGKIIQASLRGINRSQNQDLNAAIANACIGPMAAVERGADPHAKWPAAKRAIESSVNV